MKLSKATIRNFRRLEDVTIDVEERETVFVGPNNSGKTSATAIFRAFLGTREFKVHDFSVARIETFDEFGAVAASPQERTGANAATVVVDAEGAVAAEVPAVAAAQPEERIAASGEAPAAVAETSPSLPEISLDLWFTIDPESIAFGRVYMLLQTLSDEPKVGLRLTFGVDDPERLRSDYRTAYPKPEEGPRAKTLFEFLSLEGNLSRYCVVRHYSLRATTDAGGKSSVTAVRLDPEEGKRLVNNLVRAEFVDAQRNINDDEGSRANRLSTAFASYYRKNLQQISAAAEAQSVIDANNTALTEHYGLQFKSLMDLIRGLGVPSINDRELQIISALSPEVALKGSTELIYVDAGRNHRLPEPYNGLGFKNLIYMAIQARHFHSQWIATTENRPLCLLIFIEEPEVHLHAQVQQTFINNIWSVIKDSAEEAGESELVPQLVVTTHSSHILDTVDFEKVRYFQRCHLDGETNLEGIRNASVVHSLRAFQPDDETEVASFPVDETDDAQRLSAKEALVFLKRYLRLTHCDLFFADAAILVEGAVEKLLLPTMIDKVAGRLRGTYLTVLEVGGAYAHRFEALLSFLKIPYLVITDLDSVNAKGYPRACRGDTLNARTSNASLKKFCKVSTVSALLALSTDDKRSAEKDRCIAFQIAVEINVGGVMQSPIPRTLEEAIAYENLSKLHAKSMSIGLDISTTWPALYQEIYDQIRSDQFKKTAFAMSLLATDADWTTPSYITEGLQWLEGRLCPVKTIAAEA
ncbi:MAG: ATP-dependent endonuclease [Bradyrhizobium sp.]|nr:ATP-dependent endonuclease [Bradyrhizobium sp.]